MPANTEHQKVTLITGASRGIGAACAKLFAENDYAVCLNYLSNTAAAERVQAEITDAGGLCVLMQADVSIAAEVQAMFASIDAQFGRLDVLVNNAGILETQCRFSEITESRFRRIFETNVISCFLCCQQAVQRMSSGGCIVNVSSMASKTGSPNEYIDYATSKGAMDSLTIGLAKEVAAEGIRVNGVRPGLIYTDMHASGGEPGRVDRLKERIPLQRGGQPSEIAEAIYWLASENSSFVTGTFIDTSGGL
ncbi:SDR family oxidoreductase [Reinekea marinisedimentorum]|uniref:NAD(P)-dependent dehydrogenase (Short-subunit alcohol dehydrogenase family) n=1 Tax=Reinekea marinisedimentorum TaxID=230495 RepID=A0A4R3IBE1_9GAMM|nr:SDR family oxidoreductase [Reinekea marinisedimentorum]TCS43304.1 NAD(P)-dependent dehydrogenase (short-subunit alcohol dehydrogenase family) [Reinekea marinisedimentorum]